MTDIHKYHRRSIRLEGYDYSRQGAYFITICTQNRKHLFGKIINGKMELNEAGKMIQNTWNKLPTRFNNIILDESIIMPTHTHFIIIITSDISNPRTGESCIRPHTSQYIRPNTSPYIRPHTSQYIRPHTSQYTSPQISSSIHPNPLNYDPNQIFDNRYTGNFYLVGDHPNEDHPNKDHPNEDHPNEDHPNEDHPNEDHPNVNNSFNKDRPRGTLEGSMGRIIQAYKSITTHEYIINVKQNEWVPFPGKLWQRDYWEHIVRNETELNRIRKYIKNNPAKWQTDKLNAINKNISMEKQPQYGEEIWMV